MALATPGKDLADAQPGEDALGSATVSARIRAVGGRSVPDRRDAHLVAQLLERDGLAALELGRPASSAATAPGSERISAVSSSWPPDEKRT